MPGAPRTQRRLTFAGLRHVLKAVDGPRQSKRPVALVDRRRLVDAIQPAKHILHRKQDEIRSGFDQRFEQRVANRRVERRRAQIDGARRDTLDGREPATSRRSCADADCHQTASVSVSCVPEVATDAGG